MRVGNTYQGSPCRRGHDGTRYIKGGGCVECRKERARTDTETGARRKPRDQWQPRRKLVKSDEAKQAMRLAANARRRLQRAADPTYRARANMYQVKHERRDPTATRARKLAWYHVNPDTRKAQRHRRRAAQRDAAGNHTAHDLRNILAWQGGHCAYCDACQDLHLDHVIPLSRGGTNWPWNLQFLCAFHNTSKGARTDVEYRAAAGLPMAEPLSWLVWRAVFAA